MQYVLLYLNDVYELFSLCRSKPLQIWDKNGKQSFIYQIYYTNGYFYSLVRNGHIKRITDPDIQSSVLEIMGTNVSTTFITCPADPKKVLGIKLPFLVMIIKNVSNFHYYFICFLTFKKSQLRKYFTFEVMVLDDKNVRRRFRASNYQVCICI